MVSEPREKKRRKADGWIKEVSIEILLFYYFFFIFRSSFLPSTNTTPSMTSLSLNSFFFSIYCLCRSFNWFRDWIDYYYYSRQNTLFVERSDGFDTRSSHIIISSSVVITPIVRISEGCVCVTLSNSMRRKLSFIARRNHDVRSRSSVGQPPRINRN